MKLGYVHVQRRIGAVVQVERYSHIPGVQGSRLVKAGKKNDLCIVIFIYIITSGAITVAVCVRKQSLSPHVRVTRKDTFCNAELPFGDGRRRGWAYRPAYHMY